MSNRPEIQFAEYPREPVKDWSAFIKLLLGVRDDRHLYEQATPDADDIARADAEARAQP